MLAIISQGIGGLGIFFAGMYLLSENLKKLTGRRFRQTVAAWTRTVWAIIEGGTNATTARLAGSVVEGLDTVLLTVVDAMGPDGDDDRMLLRHMSGDRRALRRRLREEYLAGDSGLSASDKMSILSTTNLTERASWLINRLIDTLSAPVAGGGRTPAVEGG